MEEGVADFLREFHTEIAFLPDYYGKFLNGPGETYLVHLSEAKKEEIRAIVKLMRLGRERLRLSPQDFSLGVVASIYHDIGKIREDSEAHHSEHGRNIILNIDRRARDLAMIVGQCNRASFNEDGTLLVSRVIYAGEVVNAEMTGVVRPGNETYDRAVKTLKEIAVHPQAIEVVRFVKDSRPEIVEFYRERRKSSGVSEK
ncbi:MAG: hypothetical protein QW331_02860 [Candidatus Woesearchaeota archaeon]